MVDRKIGRTSSIVVGQEIPEMLKHKLHARE